MLNYLMIMLGGAIGTGARFWLSGVVAQRYGEFLKAGLNAVLSLVCCVFAVWVGRTISVALTSR
jgi:fluoride ion exporter CrcB/FEX